VRAIVVRLLAAFRVPNVVRSARSRTVRTNDADAARRDRLAPDVQSSSGKDFLDSHVYLVPTNTDADRIALSWALSSPIPLRVYLWSAGQVRGRVDGADRLKEAA
jgi:hypothetical protein